MLSRTNLLKSSNTSLLKPWRPSMGPCRRNHLNEYYIRKISISRPKSAGNTSVLGHVNEEAGKYGRDSGGTEPDLTCGTPLQDIIKNDIKSKRLAPKVIRDDIQNTERSKEIQKILDHSDSNTDIDTTFANLLAIEKLENVSNTGQVEDETEDSNINKQLTQGHKFGLPELPIPRDGNFKYRDDPIIQQVTNLLMKHGKKSVAQRNMSFILNTLRTAPPPKFNPARPLIPGHPPAHHLPLDPVGYLTLAIDSVAPLLRIRSERGAAGGGAALQIPVPLGKRQRRRQTVMWILDSVNKRTSRGSGRGTFAQRVADEIISIVEGRSPAWEKRLMVHKTGTTARNNVNFRRRR